MRVHTNSLWPTQAILESQLYNIFPSENIIKNARKEASLKNPHTGWYLEVDMWLPDLNLCLEFQDDYHYMPAGYAQIPLLSVRRKDNIKRNMLLEKGQTLILVPYWWDSAEKSLRDTIHFHRPDLQLCYTNTEIPCNPAPSFPDGYKQLMLASFPDDISVFELMARNAWWLGEKWDGVRCNWNSTKKQLFSRRNVAIHLRPVVHNVFVSDSLVNIEMDGELWCGRGFYHESHSISVAHWAKTDCSFLRMVCFDEASLEMHHEPFEKRYALVLYISVQHPIVTIAPRFLCTSETAVLGTLQQIIKAGGEGVILRKPLSLYYPGRSRDLVKIKGTQRDHEALVVKVEPNGSLVLQLPNGFTFPVAKEDCMFPQRAVKGDIVTFSFDLTHTQRINSVQKQQSIGEAARGTPSNMVVHRIRSDMSWDDVLMNDTIPSLAFGNETHQFFKSLTARYIDKYDMISDKHKKVLRHYYQKYPELEILFPQLEVLRKKPKHQSWKTSSQRRAFFDTFAALKGKDPLSASFWYGVKIKELQKYHPAYNTIASYYGDKLSTTLMHLYPDIGLKKLRFKFEYQWKEPSARKQYFDEFAASRGEDALNPNFWYSVSSYEISRYRPGSVTIASYYGGSLASALINLYPNIGLQKNWFKFQSKTQSLFRKKYFNNFAAAMGQDPLNPVFWHSVTTQDLLNFQNGHGIKYESNLYAFLKEQYPNIGLKISKFKEKSWKVESDRKAYFDGYAASVGGDPSSPSFWSGVSYQHLRSYHKGLTAILKYYGGRLTVALAKLYPDIGLRKVRRLNTWKNVSEQRSFFDNYAETQKMDSLNPVFWYHVTQQDLRRYNDAYTTIVAHYDKKLSSTLMAIYPDIGLKRSCFSESKQSWTHESERRAFFDDFAASQRKDPLVPEFWYRVYHAELKRFNPGYKSIRRFYGGALSSALMQLYPNIGLDLSKFKA